MSSPTIQKPVWESGNKQNMGLSLFAEVWQHRHLVAGLVWKNFVAAHRQTLLGWLWLVVKPLLMGIIYLVVFVQIFQVSTQGIPPILFFLGGNTLWQLFSDVANSTSSTITTNAATWNKIYFPRLVSPISHLMYLLIMFSGQFLIFLAVWIVFLFKGSISLHVFSLPWSLLAMVLALMMAFGTGLIVSVFAVRYRDLNLLLGIALRAIFCNTCFIYLGQSSGQMAMDRLGQPAFRYV